MDGSSKCGDEEMGLSWSTESSGGSGKLCVGPQSSQMGVGSVVMRQVLCWSTEQSDGSDKCDETGFVLVHRTVRWEWQVW